MPIKNKPTGGAPVPNPPTTPLPAPAGPTTVSPEAAIARDPQTGQALNDPSLQTGDVDDLPDGGARSSRHTGEDPKH